MQLRQMVLPRFQRKSNSPILIPMRNNREKKMMRPTAQGLCMAFLPRARSLTNQEYFLPDIIN
jgi:hypothetical protein